MALLIMIRHGESIANVEQRFTQREDEPLTPRGIEQARATAVIVRVEYRPTIVYSSPYRRAMHTAEIIAGEIGLEPVVVPRLREQNFGDLKGQSYSSYFGQEPMPVGAERWTRSPPRGESLQDVARRTGPELDVLARRHLGEQVVVVSHGGVMAALRAHIAGHYDDAPQPTLNAGGFVIEATTDGYTGPRPLSAS